MVEVNFTDLALADIENIAKFIAKDSEKYAGIQVQRFFARAEILETNPLAGKMVLELNDKLIRELVMGNYRIIYRIVNLKRIDIITVHSSFMLLSNSPAFR
jgi:addiction module RelE/StbE family toxin